MRQFDVCEVIGGTRNGVELAVILQDEGLSRLSTRIVAPVIFIDGVPPIERGTVAVELDGLSYLVPVHLLMSVRARGIGRPIGSLSGYEAALKNALDVVFFGV